jgi:hypothetical protein
MSNLANLVASLDGIPTPTPQQYADARAYLERHAPDLVEVVLGVSS